MDVTQEGLKLFAVWLLAFVRFVGFFVQAPIWGSHHFDKKILIASAAAWTFILFPGLPVPNDLTFDLLLYIIMIALQFLVGLVIGYVSFMVMAAAQFGGELLDTQMGLSVAASYDPASGSSVNMMRRMKFYLCMILFLCFNGHHALVRALFKSFEIIPLTGVAWNYELLHQLILVTGQIFYLGVQIASPGLAALFITQVGLGMLARVAPQMNVFMLSFPLNIAIGLTMITAALGALAVMYSNLFEENFRHIEGIMRSLGLL